MLLRIGNGLYRRSAGWRGCGGVVDDVFQFLAGLEIRNLLGRDFHASARLGISPDARLTLTSAETAESTDLDFVSRAQGTDDAVEDSLHDDLGLLPGHLHDAGDFFNQVGLRHRISPKCLNRLRNRSIA